MYGFKALIFDVDGTLADTERDGHRPAFNAAFADAGLDWEWSAELYGELLSVTGGKERILHYMSQWRPEFVPPREVTEFVADLHRRKTAHYLELVRGGTIPLRPGVHRILRQAREEGIRLAIATTTTVENVTTLLDCCGEPGLAEWFEVIAAGDVVPAKKPAPDIFLFALEGLGLEPEACVAIEDSENGVRAALGAHLKALLVTRTVYTKDHDFSGAALIVDGLGDVHEHLSISNGSADEPECIDLKFLSELHSGVYGNFSR